ncbi:UDP-glucuronosyltransferase 2C1-like [Branchiostoma floridae]|uniref:UDP-glucuronosyltransferase 2C1-like n=1 Tax=Branchiostoma floridae TaxID=7739 RepID=A0A9J7MGJ4_BRAFL|nr:UDP-glucuronosyltransferase 2C1-like [Branchiostoma floridae]
MDGRLKRHFSIIPLVLLCFMLSQPSSAEKVLLVPMPCFNSHWMVEASIGQALVERDHAVTVVIEDDIVEKRRTERPDFTCGTIVAANLGIPHVAISSDGGTFFDKIATGVPLPLSYIPTVESPFTDQMTFLQRVENAWFFGLSTILKSWIYGYVYNDLVRNYISDNETIQSVTSRTDLWLYQSDTVLGFPSPSMPSMVQVGGLTVRTGVQLSEDLEDFMQSSGDAGVIVVSFGSMVHAMSMEKKEMFTTVFARLRQKVVWRYVGEKPAGLGNNTKLMSWLPQNDLLAHPRTRAFVNHAGLNGVYEALYHGVPMVCLPLFGEQPSTAARVAARGMGEMLDFRTVTSDQLYQAILRVLTNNSFSDTAARLSRLHRDQPQSPMERAVWWIEHVIKHGGLPHLRARAVELPWYQYYLLDVAVSLLGICSAVTVEEIN